MTIRLRCCYCRNTAELLVAASTPTAEVQRAQAVCRAHEGRGRRWCSAVEGPIRTSALAGIGWRQLTINDALAKTDPR